MSKPVFFSAPDEFHEWLKEHHKEYKELWVGFYKTATGLPSMTWPESVDQALCFGWIDGIRKSLGEKSYMIRFTPRRPTSIWSAVNIRRFGELKKMGLVSQAGEVAFKAKKESHTSRYSFEQGKLELPAEYLKRFKSNKPAWKFFQSLPPSVRKPSVWYVLSAKKEDTRLKRLQTLIACSEKEKRIPQLTITRNK